MNLNSVFSFLRLGSAALLAIGLTPDLTWSLPEQPTEPSSATPPSRVSYATNPLDPLDHRRIDARSITVEISSPNVWGTGVIIQRELQGSQFRYWVLTNDHVLQSSTTVNLKTNDDQIHEGRSIPLRNLAGNDLALIEFTSPQTYMVATFADPGSIQPWGPVYIAGFPLEHQSQNRPSFELVPGEIILIPDHSLEAGYQVGYHSNTAKGMSGGPVLNERNEVVAIHGLGAFPFWGNPYTYQDGSPAPCEPLWQVMYRLSWGIPIEIIEEVIPQALTIASPTSDPPLSVTQSFTLLVDTPFISLSRNDASKSWAPQLGTNYESGTHATSPQTNSLSLEELETRALVTLAKACLPLSSSFRPN
jgi:S1-C subfamily serine protease